MIKLKFEHSCLFGIFLIVVFALVFGGTSQPVTNFKQLIYILCPIVLVILLYLKPEAHVTDGKLNRLILFLVIIAAFVLLSLVPLPYYFWSKLSGRSVIVDVFNLVETDLMFMPLSMAPERTWLGLLSLIPLLTILILLAHIRDRMNIYRLVWIFPLCAFVFINIGFLQINGLVSDKIYKVANFGYPIGLFSNVNHMGTLLIMSMPFTAYLFFTERAGFNRNRVLLPLAIIFLVTVVGVFYVNSVAAYGLFALQILIFTLLAINKISIRRFRYLIFVMLGGGLIYVGFNINVLEAMEIQMGSSNLSGRTRMLLSSLPLIKETFPFGTGLGGFEDVYKAYEKPSSITPRFVNHVHNDFVELIIEMGIFGIIFIGFFSYQFVMKAFSLLKAGQSLPSLQLAAANSILIVMVHSGFDYPLRTLAIAVLFTIASALMFGSWLYTSDNKL